MSLGVLYVANVDMVQKNLQKDSIYNELDINQDGTVDDSELAAV